jgi:hypothetical protein
MQIRILLSSLDSSRNFDARCHVRERLIAFVNHQYPECLPQLRAEMSTKTARPNPQEPDMTHEIERQPPV